MFRKLHLLIAAAVLLSLVAAPSLTPARAASSQCMMYHTVQPGDNLFRLARTYKTNIYTLMAWNGLYNANRIYVGQLLCVGRQTIVDTTYTTYFVRPGDSLYRIAQQFGISMKVLADVNYIVYPYRIYVGQMLRIPQITIQ